MSKRGVGKQVKVKQYSPPAEDEFNSGDHFQKWMGLDFGQWIVSVMVGLVLFGFFVGVVMALF